MNAEPNPIDEIEQGLDIAEASTSADAETLLANAQQREKIAYEAYAQASTDDQRLAAYIEGMKAVEEQIRIKSADSKANWELGNMTNQDGQ